MSLTSRPTSALRNLLTGEAGGGLILMVSAALALVIANSPAAPTYFAALKAYLGPLSVLHWINDALMAVFFLLVGLEIKREMLDGRLRTWPDRILPGVAAFGGMAAPALVYVAVNWHSPETLRGWAIPAATDIAFALGVLALLGSRVPVSLKVFLTALAIIDDLGAVLIIAAFYTADLSLPMLSGAAATFAVLFAMNKAGVSRLLPYLLIGAILWLFVLKSGIHATVAGVLLAFTIPLRLSIGKPDDPTSPLHKLEHALHPWSAYLVLPVFGFANAGVSLAGFDPKMLLDPVTLGVALGLFLGKQIGVFGFVLATVKLGLAQRPAHASWPQVYGVALLCGVGFTMSLFIGLLAFANAPELEAETKIGVLVGSIGCMLLGALVLRFAPPRPLLKGRH
ncbi:Na+/H+ antiporter NhaA [Methylobacterium sp. WL30]|uniref:Na+/H+ antiporter NhaA n=1 Tax=unclassified Methylobacterium TaxID=2615210 RepID=UPI0011C8677A|nr:MULTISPECIES: Na+/H+ antiporter NhaA [unclassified Methylobacterium]TXN41465.1 Na+/H+ antiporter NhaA [Methylobacterium sp. WL93]TXN50561.1 Na+/H+ antiporter NhaA [Methylobacterium sp. WL119]TXN67023.1 Na+/H+ antiporter NhaA [Methylobacterium sp. WL30]